MPLTVMLIGMLRCISALCVSLRSERKALCIS